MLSKNVMTHYLLLKEWEKNIIKKIPITESQHEFYKSELELKKYSDFITISDPDTWNIIFEWRCNKVEWFEEIIKDPDLYEKRWVCSFWVRHTIPWFPDNCQCSKEFDCLWITFKWKLKEMWYKINYDSDITEYHRKKYLQEQRL